jgi:heme/copper-type cytochrome/quinol oxidase subunit 2
MDTTRLVIWVMGVIMIGIGLPLFYLARYLLTPEDKKSEKARDVKVIGIIWMAVGVLIYLAVLISIPMR